MIQQIKIELLSLAVSIVWVTLWITSEFWVKAPRHEAASPISLGFALLTSLMAVGAYFNFVGQLFRKFRDTAMRVLIGMLVILPTCWLICLFPFWSLGLAKMSSRALAENNWALGLVYFFGAVLLVNIILEPFRAYYRSQAIAK